MISPGIFISASLHAFILLNSLSVASIPDFHLAVTSQEFKWIINIH
jgi:hypothetical protein